MNDDLNQTASEAVAAAVPVINVVAAADQISYDIANEQYRYYTYPNGDRFTVSNPVKLYIVNDSHRVVDADGVTHRPERGYVGISWKPVAGAPAFDF